MILYAYIIGILSGAALPVQTSLNTRAGRRLGESLLGALVSFIGGTALTSLILLFLRQPLLAPWGEVRGEPLWIWTGGALGLVLVILNMMILPRLGSVETVIFSVLGQILTGLAVDNFGWFYSGQIRMTWIRALGALLVIVGTAMTAAEKGASSEPFWKKSSASVWLCRLGGIASGAAGGLQVAVNGYLGAVVGSAFQATLFSTGNGLVIMVLICAVLSRIRPDWRAHPDRSIKNRWWLWTGGFCGVACVGANVMLARVFGTGMAVVVTLIGQIGGGIVVDRIGFLGIEKKPVTVRKLAGFALVIAGAVLIRLI